MSRYVLSRAAASDVEDIVCFLDEHAPHAADVVLRSLEDAMQRLAEHPGLGHLREDLADEAVRFYPVWSYLIVYRAKEYVEVVRVLHAARDVRRELHD